MQAAGYILTSCLRGYPLLSRRCLHQTYARLVFTNLQMPAMSPTMTEGGISSWKKDEGETFSAGDVLMEIETDKATIDVEAQDDGILAKILAPSGTKNVPVGKVIALLAEEGDDISNVEVPKEDVTSSVPLSPPPSPKPEPMPEKQLEHHPAHSRSLLPSVLRLLVEYNITNPEAITGSGVRGQLTKGDVLAYLGKASSPTGTYKEHMRESPAPRKGEVVKPLDGTTTRQLIMLGLTYRTRTRAPVLSTLPTFDAVIVDYLPQTSRTPDTGVQDQSIPPVGLRDPAKTYFDGLL